ncbi:chain length determinant protein EpsF [Aquabacterium sp.]|uniref:chain length determinant protein EpsF n=1 Tax=Aquabacterium sp. TaxID=1872578 RepID=UPI002E3478A8|nr:chain length determinant protein EpsF [Aquabacterium sp.]HEX5310251.1 chain length determinant protein EpsF [Aquabacterium sp.]
MTLTQLTTVLKARRLVIFATAGAFLALSAGVSLVLPKKYSAVATVVIDNKATDPINGLVPGLGGQGYLLTQIDILRSDRVAKKVVNNLKLTESPILKDKWQSATDGRGSFVGWIGNWLQTNTDIKPAKESNVIDITYISPDPKFSAAVANAFAQAYMETAVELRNAPAKQYSNYFDEQLRRAKGQLDAARSALSTYLKDKGLISSDERFDVEMARLAELSQQVVALRALSADTNSRQQQSRLAQGDKLQDVLNNPVVNGIKADLVRQEAQLKDLQSRYGDAHPTVQQQKAQIADLAVKLESETRRILGSVGVANQVNRSREAEVIAGYEAQRQKVLSMKQIRDEAAALNQDVESAQKAYDGILARLNQVSLESQTTQTNVSLLNSADEPAEPTSPKILLNTGVGTALGILAGILLAIRLESTNRKVRSEEDAALMFELPVLANIGKINFNPTTQSFNASNPQLGQNNKKSLASKLLPPLLKSK